MKRFYIAPVKLDEGAYVPDLPRQYWDSASVMPPTPNGTPSVPWCLCIVGTADHGPIRGHPGVHALPDATKDMKVTAVSSTLRTALKARLNALGLNGVDIIDFSEDIREMLNKIGRALDPAFSCDAFDCPDGV